MLLDGRRKSDRFGERRSLLILISFPSEWGQCSSQNSIREPDPVSIQLVSPASGDNPLRSARLFKLCGFHSISFPSEWGRHTLRPHTTGINRVSIQLVSPASGDEVWTKMTSLHFHVSIQLVSPASGDFWRSPSSITRD